MSKLIVPGVAFMIASSPATFKVTRKVFGSWVGNFEGVATPAGLFLHMLFFLLVLWLTGKYLPMILPHLSGYDDKQTEEQKKAMENIKKIQAKIASNANPSGSPCSLGRDCASRKCKNGSCV
jgi:hypothetical protein